MPAAKHTLFSEHSVEGREFVRLWNSAYRRGIQKRLMERFGVSVATVYTIRKKLGLADLHDYKNHPGVRKFYKRVMRLYLKKDRSTLQIARIVRMCDENVRKILLKQGVELRAQHVTNPAYFKTGSALTPAQLLVEIKRLYVDERLPARRIAKRLGVDESAVRTKLRALGIRIVLRKVFEEQLIIAPNRNIKGIYLGTSEPYTVIHIAAKTVTHKGRGIEKRKKAECQWCGTVFPQYVDKGPRTQKFCGSPCSNRAKDYRRLLKGSRISQARLDSYDEALRKSWGASYDEARGRILDVVPAVKKWINGGRPQNTSRESWNKLRGNACSQDGREQAR